jgi:hypothetical protein
MSLENLVDKDGRPLTEIWPQVRLFQDVQDILDRNRILIAEINHNHQLGTNVALERNVPMLRELNSNIAKVVQSYKKAADSFVTALFPVTSEADAQQHAAAQQMPEGPIHCQPQPHQPQQHTYNQTQQTADPSSVQQP